MTSKDILGTCDKNQYEHVGAHVEIKECGQKMPPFPCVNWNQLPSAPSPAGETASTDDCEGGECWHNPETGYLEACPKHDRIGMDSMMDHERAVPEPVSAEGAATLLGRSKQEWLQHVERLFEIAVPGEDIPRAALLHGWQGKVTAEDFEWAQKQLATVAAPIAPAAVSDAERNTCEGCGEESDDLSEDQGMNLLCPVCIRLGIEEDEDG